MNPLRSLRARRPLAAVSIALLLLAASCSGSDNNSANLVPLDDPAPGVLYVSTVAGDIQVVTPSNGDTSPLLLGTEDPQAVLDLAPAPGTGGLQALVRASGQTFTSTVVSVTGSGFADIDAPSEALTCLDPHTNAEIPVAHETASGPSNGAVFNPITFGGATLDDNGFDMTSVACPRWTADRNTVATAIPTRQGDPSSFVTVVQTADGERTEIGFNQCGTTPTSFSPDDQFLAVSLVCYSASWESSGLYLVPMDSLAEVTDLSALTRLGSGLYARSAWYPDGEWIATVRSEPIELQNIAQDLSAQPTSLQVIEIETGQTIDLPLADAATPFSMTWLEESLG